jgi:antitoxin protein of toxin-antitoxin system
MGMFDEAKQQAEKAVKDHPDQAEKFSDEGIQRAGQAADQATHDKYSDKVDKAEEAADKKIGE